LPRPYVTARAAAERAYAHGRYAEAGEQWLVAAKAAERRRDRSEARYRAAASFQRAGNNGRAAALYDRIARETPRSARSARAAFDGALLELSHGNARYGERLLLSFVLEHADSGVAPRALVLYLGRFEQRGGTKDALAELERLAGRLENTELAERVMYERGRYLERLERAAEARDAYLECARLHGYPRGALWDDALWRAAEIDEHLGNPRAAIAHLERMLREREPSHLQGSYERPRYAEAQFKIAELYRDKIKNLLRARRAFRKVSQEHTTSVLRDDALWQEALLAKKDGDARGACAPLRLLIADEPHSRYAACARLLCPALKDSPERECRRYVARKLNDELNRR
jgi:tetratricopeptide (TPR) repeat protein